MKITTKLCGFLVALATSITFSATAYAAPIKTLFLGADNNLDGVLTDIIGSDARFDVANSAAFAAQGGTPTLSELQQYDSVLYWTNYYPASSIALGDALADYVDGGGHVVRATFVGQEVPNSGRIAMTGYAPFTTGRFDAYSAACLGSFDANSPILAGVTNICATVYRGDWSAGLDVGATLLASWSDGRPFVGINAAHTIIDISLFPNSAQYGHASGDYRTLFANALANCTPVSVPEPGSIALIGLGLIGVVRSRRRK